jgi:hypothetical protein
MAFGVYLGAYVRSTPEIYARKPVLDKSGRHRAAREIPGQVSVPAPSHQPRELSSLTLKPALIWSSVPLDERVFGVLTYAGTYNPFATFQTVVPRRLPMVYDFTGSMKARQL